MRGSWNRKPATGYKVVRIRFDNGTPTRFEDFLTGFLSTDGTAHYGRPTGLAVYADGSLLLSDDTNGVIYQISYDGPSSQHTE
jgi:glucose/arabinose dehydrogenase